MGELDEKQFMDLIPSSQQLSEPTVFPAVLIPPESVRQLNKPEILFWVETAISKGDIVVYEATKEPKTMDHYNNISVYWSRKKGVITKKALGILEKRAFGFRILNEPRNGPKEYSVILHVDSSIILTLVTSADGIPRIVATIQNKICYLKKIYVQATEHWLGPKVSYIELYGIEVDNPQQIHIEKVHHFPR